MFQIGEKVQMQDHISKRCTKAAGIIDIRPDAKLYVIIAKNGREYIR